MGQGENISNFLHWLYFTKCRESASIRRKTGVTELLRELHPCKVIATSKSAIFEANLPRCESSLDVTWHCEINCVCGAGAVRMRKTSSANILEVVRDRTRHRSVCIYVKSMHDVRGLIAIIHEIFTKGPFKIFVSFLHQYSHLVQVMWHDPPKRGLIGPCRLK